jgi:hypothetical protein
VQRELGAATIGQAAGRGAEILDLARAVAVEPDERAARKQSRLT